MSALRIDVLTLFPKMFESPFAESIVARARTAGSGFARLPSRYSSEPNKFGLIAPRRRPRSAAYRRKAP